MSENTPQLSKADEYDLYIADWKRKHGVPESVIQSGETIQPGELRMMAEDAKNPGRSYCWMCAEEFPIKEMLIETSPYNQMDEGAIDDDGYVAEENRVRKCKACAKREEDEEDGMGDCDED